MPLCLSVEIPALHANGSPTKFARAEANTIEALRAFDEKGTRIEDELWRKGLRGICNAFANNPASEIRKDSLTIIAEVLDKAPHARAFVIDEMRKHGVKVIW